ALIQPGFDVVYGRFLNTLAGVVNQLQKARRMLGHGFVLESRPLAPREEANEWIRAPINRTSSRGARGLRYDGSNTTTMHETLSREPRLRDVSTKLSAHSCGSENRRGPSRRSSSVM